MKTPLVLVGLAPLVLGLLIGGAAHAPAPVGAQAKPIVWNLPHVAAPTYYHTVNLNAFAEKVKELSKGRMEIRVHPASSLYPGPELIPAVVDGRVELAPVLSAYLTDIFLEMGVLELPFMTGSIEEHRKAAEQLRGFYTEALARRGVKLLTVHTWPSQQLFSAQPIRTLADWRGKKLRVYGAESADLVRSLGGAPVSIPFGEVYTALQRGVVDGAMTSATNAEPMKFYEVSKYLNYWYLTGASIEWLGANQKAWDALPKDLQQVVLDALRAVRFEDKEWEDARAWDDRARRRAQELGMTIVDPPQEEIAKARAASRAAWDTWLKRTGPEGKRALDLALRALGRAA
jgi:TRAP-type C4-dicarboxylate transport system substrate-binding protein